MIQSLTEVPPPQKLKQLCKSIAMLEAIIMDAWQWRYYSFQEQWDDGIDLFSMRTGSGDEMTVVFTPEGVLTRGFAHESPRSPYRVHPPKPYEGILEGVDGV